MQELAEALHEFVEKDKKNALAEAVERVLQETRDAAGAREEAAAERGGDPGVAGQRPDSPAVATPSPELGKRAKPIQPAAEQEEATVLGSIAAATAARRALHGLSSEGGPAGGTQPPAAAQAGKRGAKAAQAASPLGFTPAKRQRTTQLQQTAG